MPINSTKKHALNKKPRSGGTPLSDSVLDNNDLRGKILDFLSLINIRPLLLTNKELRSNIMNDITHFGKFNPSIKNLYSTGIAKVEFTNSTNSIFLTKKILDKKTRIVFTKDDKYGWVPVISPPKSTSVSHRLNIASFQHNIKSSSQRFNNISKMEPTIMIKERNDNIEFENPLKYFNGNIAPVLTELLKAAHEYTFRITPLLNIDRKERFIRAKYTTKTHTKVVIIRWISEYKILEIKITIIELNTSPKLTTKNLSIDFEKPNNPQIESIKYSGDFSTIIESSFLLDIIKQTQNKLTYTDKIINNFEKLL